MSTPTKTAITLVADSTSNTGNSSTTGSQDLTDAFGAILNISITNGGTAPTTACDATISYSNDNTKWREAQIYTQEAAANVEVQFVHHVPATVEHVQIVFEGNDDQAVEVECEGSEITSIG